MPRRIRFYQVTTPQTPILFRAIPWFAPLSEPLIKRPARLPEPEQQAYAGIAYPYFYPIQFNPRPNEPNPPRPPSLPTPEQQAYAGIAYPYFYPVPFIPRANEPNPPRPPSLPTPEQQAYAGIAYPYFYPLPFLPQLSEPIVKTPRRLLEADQQVFATVAPPIFLPLPWLPQLSEPVVKTPPRLLEANQQAYAGPNYAYFYPIPWFVPLSEPVVKTPARLVEANQQAYSGPTPILFAAIPWYDPLSEPVRTPLRLPEALHLATPGFLAQPPPPAVQSIQWFTPLSEPVRSLPRFTERQQFYTGPNYPYFNPLPWLVHQKVMRVRSSRRYGSQEESPSPPPPPPQLGFLQPTSVPTPRPKALGDEFSIAICFPGITNYSIAPWVRVQGLCSNSSSVTLPAAVTSGNLIVGVVAWNTTSGTITLSSVTDNAGNTYIITNNVADTGNSEAAAAFILGNITNGPTQFTANFSSAPSITAICVTEYFGGLASNDPRDGNTAQFQQSIAVGVYDAISSGSVVTAQPGDLIWGAYAVTSGATVLPFAGSRFNLREKTPNNILLVTEDQRQANAGTTLATFTDNNNQSSATFVVAIKAAFFSLRWYQQWVDPVRPKPSHHYSDIAWAGPPFQLTPTQFPLWFSPLSEPVRVPPRLIEGRHQVYAGNPAPSFLQTLPWLPQLSEPIVKTARRLSETMQQSFIAQPPAINFPIPPWQFIQSNVGFSSSTANISATFAAVGLANLVVGVVTYDTVGATVTLSTVTDDQSNTYFIANNVIDANNNQGTASFILGNIRNAPTTVTAHFSGLTNTAIIISEYSGGLNAADPRDTNAGQQQQSPGTGLNAITSGLVLTTQNGDLIWGANDNTTGNNLLPFTGSGFNQRQTINNASGVLSTEDQRQANSGLVAATFTRSVNYSTSTLVIAIRPASDIARTFQPLSEPIIKTPSRLLEASQQFYASVQPPIFFAAMPWFVPLSEPVRLAPRLSESAQLTWAAPNWPAQPTKLPWFVPLSEPVRFRPILGAALNPDLSRALPIVPTDKFVVNAVETGDVGNLSSIGFITPLSITLSIHETL